jgi:hypothetical protein
MGPAAAILGRLRIPPLPRSSLCRNSIMYTQLFQPEIHPASRSTVRDSRQFPYQRHFWARRVRVGRPHRSVHLQRNREIQLWASRGFVRIARWLGIEVAGRPRRWPNSHIAATAFRRLSSRCCAALPALHAQLSRRRGSPGCCSAPPSRSRSPSR